MPDIDLTGVDPRRWPEIRRRVAAIREYIALGRRDGAKRDELAARIGINPMFFLSLVKAWKEHGEACRLPGSGVLDRSRPRPARSLPQASRDAIIDAIAALGVEARHVDLVADVNRRCDLIGTKRPSTGMVQRLVMQARSAAPAVDGPPEILIGRVIVKLPMLRNGGTLLPDVLVAVLSPEGVVAAHVVDDGDAEEAQLMELLDRLQDAASPEATGRRLLAPPSMVRPRTGPLVGMAMAAPTSARLVRLLGARLGMLDITHRRKATTHAPSDGSPMNAPLGEEEVTTAVRASIDVHNAARGGAPAFNVAGPRRTTGPCTRDLSTASVTC